MEYKITLPCSNGFTLHSDGDNIIISTKKADETIPISRIQSFTLKEPGLSFGKITFATAQAASTGVGIGLGVGVALGAEKTFFFAKKDLDTAKQLKDMIASHREGSQQPAPVDGKVVSIVEELRGLKELLDEGVLTQAEFEAQKAKLLNR